MFRDMLNSPAESGLAAKMAGMAEIATLFSTVVMTRGAFRFTAGWMERANVGLHSTTSPTYRGTPVRPLLLCGPLWLASAVVFLSEYNTQFGSVWRARHHQQKRGLGSVVDGC